MSGWTSFVLGVAQPSKVFLTSILGALLHGEPTRFLNLCVANNEKFTRVTGF